MSLKDTLSSYQKDLTSWRRDFHMHPETGFQEVYTSGRIVEILQEMHNVHIEKDFCKTAVIAEVKGNSPGPIVGVRADMDALPLQDAKDVPYRSQNAGVCHACGHDAHITVGLGLVRYYSEHPEMLKGRLKVIFQPAEEGPAPGGAKLLVDSGKVNDVQYMLAAHTNPDNPVGSVLLRRKEILASADNLKIVVHGTGGHGAYPHQAKDPLRCGIEIYNALQLLMTREADPVKAALLSICSLNAGTFEGTNVIPASVCLSGTLRTFNNDLRDFLVERIKQVVHTVCELSGCTAEVDISTVSIAMLNNDKMVDIIHEVCCDVYGKENVRYMDYPEMGYDDFAYFGTIAPAAFLYFGTTAKADLGKFTFHQPLYDVDEESIPLCIEALVRTIDKLADLEG